ncbi:MAG: DUF4388 domain-containing protein [Myxococcota bacterium]
MALRGTLGDFGIADIFQLVGHQTKTGVLLLKNRETEVRIFFVEGNVVKAEHSSRNERELIGNLLVRADVLTEAQLEDALSQQQRTMLRLGDLLVESGYVTRETLREFTRLQTTETIYRLFQWKLGTYEFTQQDVEYDERSYEPLRAETVLMEGFRMVDEWPGVRQVIPHESVTFRILRELPAPAKNTDSGEEDLLAGLNDAFRAMGEGEEEPVDDDEVLGSKERLVFSLIEEGRSAAQITDRSRLGEFETTKALATLVREGYLEVEVDDALLAAATRRKLSPQVLLDAAMPFLIRVALYALVALAVGVVVKLYEQNDRGLLARDRALRVRPGHLHRQVGVLQLERVRRAVEAYRLLAGAYPETLVQVVEAGLLSADDGYFPFEGPPEYRRTDDGYLLAPPLR